MKRASSAGSLFDTVKKELSLIIESTANDTEVEAFLHETEIQYKKDQPLPFSKHITEYEVFTMRMLKTVTKPQIDEICSKGNIFIKVFL